MQQRASVSSETSVPLCIWDARSTAEYPQYAPSSTQSPGAARAAAARRIAPLTSPTCIIQCLLRQKRSMTASVSLASPHCASAATTRSISSSVPLWNFSTPHASDRCTSSPSESSSVPKRSMRAAEQQFGYFLLRSGPLMGARCSDFRQRARVCSSVQSRVRTRSAGFRALGSISDGEH